jgi:hypothetical protein
MRQGTVATQVNQVAARFGIKEASAVRLARRANALVLLDDGMSCGEVAKVLLLDDDTVRTWYRLYEDEGIEGLASFDYDGSRRRRGRAPVGSGPRPAGLVAEWRRSPLPPRCVGDHAERREINLNDHEQKRAIWVTGPARRQC